MQSLPIVPLRERIHQGVRQVFDPLRKTWLQYTHEEVVRQCLIRFLIDQMGYPASLMSAERGLTYNQLRKRWDLLIHDRDGKPLVIAECKEPRVELTADAVMQVASYNSQVNAPHILLTNGVVLLFFSRTDNGSFALREQVPPFSALVG